MTHGILRKLIEIRVNNLKITGEGCGDFARLKSKLVRVRLEFFFLFNRSLLASDPIKNFDFRPFDQLNIQKRTPLLIPVTSLDSDRNRFEIFSDDSRNILPSDPIEKF